MKNGQLTEKRTPTVWLDAELVFVPGTEWYTYYDPRKVLYLKAKLRETLFETEYFLHPEFRAFEQKVTNSHCRLELFVNESNIALATQNTLHYRVFVYEDDKLKYINTQLKKFLRNYKKENLNCLMKMILI